MTDNCSEKTLQADLLLVSQPDITKPFSSREDAFQRLASYHVFLSQKKKSRYSVLEDAKSSTQSLEKARKRAKVVEDTLEKEEASKEFRDLCELCYLESSLIQQEKVQQKSDALESPSHKL